MFWVHSERSTDISEPVDPVLTTRTLVGRDSELARVRHALDAAADASGSLVLISGEAGVGKSALVGASVEYARTAGATVLTGRCFDLSAGRPFSLWRELLDDYRQSGARSDPVPNVLNLDASVPGPADRDELFVAMRDFVTGLSERSLSVLVLEDLHWADSLSVDILRSVCRSIGGHRVVILATFRESPQADSPFLRSVPALVREGPTHRTELRSLPPDAIRGLVTGQYELAVDEAERLTEFLEQRTSGNPLLVQEMLHTLELDGLLHQRDERWELGDLQHARVPRLVQELVHNRLRRLSESSRRLVEFASIIGEHVPLELWQSAGGASAEELDQAVKEAIEANLIIESSDRRGLRFTHALIRDAVYEAITLPRRRLSHEYVADALVALPNADPDAVADHLQLAGRGDAAVEWLVRAGARALALHASDVAVERVRTAIDLSRECGVDLPPDAYHVCARGLEIQGQLDAARNDYERAFELALAAGDTRAAWQVAIDLGSAWAERDYRQARRWFDRASELAEALDDELLHARSLNRIGNWHTNREQPHRGREIHEQALTAFERAGDQAGVAETLDLMAIAACLAADLPASAALYYRVVPRLEDIGDQRGLVTALAVLPMLAGTVESQTVIPAPYAAAELLTAGERALDIARDISWPAGEAVASIHLGLRLSFIGNYQRAWELTRAGYEMASAIGHSQWRISGAMVLGSMLIDMHSPEEAVSWLQPALALSRDVQSLYWERTNLGQLGAAAIERGDLDEARRILQPLEDAAAEMNTLASRFAALQLARVELVDGYPERAQDRLEALIASNGGASAAETPHVALVYAETLASLGDLDGSLSLLESALTVAERRGERPIQWRIAALQASVEAELDRPDQAELRAERARKIIDYLSRQIDDDQRRERFLDRALERLPGRAASTANPFGLSPREIEVLRLIAEGRRDREIADELFISPRTVTNHVASILQKMDVPSRAAAAVEAVRRDML